MSLEGGQETEEGGSVGGKTDGAAGCEVLFVGEEL